ncbi:thiol-disulfide isomerase/thioredoxin [Pedobacter africanus]|uniref:Thiol-disulfide isomerase/thioredoxin n=1 Tax=Pedobacter africanus TaxID=151894 RepID=A0ACC6KTW6_9SPHI|nr:TlpA disulfide reductase family protein [Pedobacter africanus]MDR6782651.1 thiol-disulfide isomerase/thioredoxin [Pedobacter africanus]
MRKVLMMLILCASTGIASGQKKAGSVDSTAQEIVFQDTWKRQQLFKKTDLKTIPANELLKQFNEISDHSIALLKANKEKLSPAFYEKQLIDFVYHKKNNAMGIPFMLQGLGKRKLSTVIPDGYWNLDKGVKMDEQLLSNQTYVIFITRKYVDFLRLKAMAARGETDSILPAEEKTNLQYQLIEKHFSGKNRSIALRKNFETASYGAKDMQMYKPLLDKYLTQYATAEDARETLLIFEKFTRVKTGKEPPFFTLKNQDGKDVTLKDFAGKVVYMDFWSSGCGPCRYEMKNGSPKLHASFKDNKEVVFLYISIDDSADLWKKAIADDKIEGIHLLSPGGFKSPVAEAFNIMGIPRYIIIGRDGKIFDDDAPRPSQDITPARINEALRREENNS